MMPCRRGVSGTKWTRKALAGDDAGKGLLLGYGASRKARYALGKSIDNPIRQSYNEFVVDFIHGKGALSWQD